MTEEQIVKEAIELTTPLWTGCAYVRNATIQCRYELLTEMINLVNHKNEQTQALISGQESLQKLIVEKDAEIERLKEAIVSKNLTPIECKARQEHDERYIHIVNGLKAEIEQKSMDVESLTAERDALYETIAEQKAEIESLRKEVEVKDSVYQRNTGLREKRIFDLMDELKTAKSEAIKEFAEKYEKAVLPLLTSATLEKKDGIYACLNILKEMEGGGKS